MTQHTSFSTQLQSGEACRAFTVVCVDDSNPPRGVPPEQWPVKGRHYTVRELVRDTTRPGVYGYRFYQIAIDYNGFNMYNARRFAQVDAINN